jgi:hypothetical protein
MSRCRVQGAGCKVQGARFQYLAFSIDSVEIMLVLFYGFTIFTSERITWDNPI